MSPRNVTTSVWPSLFALGLALVGAAQLGARAWALRAAPPSRPLDAVLGWPLWLAVVLLVSTGRVQMWTRGVVSLLALLGAGLHVVLAVLGGLPALAAVGVEAFAGGVAAVGAPALLTAWAVWDVFRRRADRRHARERAARGQESPGVLVIHPAESPVQPLGELDDDPFSVPTPVGAPRAETTSGSASEGEWRKVTTPWPRAVEEDPDGTLLRPPRRRAAR